jgi:hypothetical protein
VKVVGTLSRRVVVGHLSDRGVRAWSGTTYLPTPPKVGGGSGIPAARHGRAGALRTVRRAETWR